MKSFLKMGLICSVALWTGLSAWAHCQVPCGIFTDQMRFEMIREQCTTIEKAIVELEKLQPRNAQDANQLIRWVKTKESHAQEIQDIVAEYFLAQRVKPAQANYEERLVLLHGIIIDAMKSKQSTDTSHVDNLRKKLDAFEMIYFAKAADAAPKAEAKGHGHAHGDHEGHSHEGHEGHSH